MTKTAVVILNYNGEKLLPEFLPSVLKYSNDAKIYVADNASTDGSLNLLRSQFPTVQVIALDKNYGFCGGYNRALHAIDASYYLLLNSDVQVTPGWIQPLENILDSHRNVAAVQPKILSLRNPTQFEYAGAAGGYIDTLGYPFCRGRIFDHVENDNHQYDDEKEIFWSTGACFLIRSEIFHWMDGFDEDFFAHMEEIDLCWKIHRTGLTIKYTGASVVYHLGAGTLGYNSPRKIYLNFRNGLILIFKHLSSAELVYKLPARILLDWLAAVFFVLQGKWSSALSVFKAHKDFLKTLPASRTKRNAIHAAHPRYSKKSIYQGMILYDYYLKRRKTF